VWRTPGGRCDHDRGSRLSNDGLWLPRPIFEAPQPPARTSRSSRDDGRTFDTQISIGTPHLSNPESGEKHQTGSIYIRELVATQEFELAENCGVVLCVDRLQGVVDMNSMPGFRSVPDAPGVLAEYFYRAAQRVTRGDLVATRRTCLPMREAES